MTGLALFVGGHLTEVFLLQPQIALEVTLHTNRYLKQPTQSFLHHRSSGYPSPSFLGSHAPLPGRSDMSCLSNDSPVMVDISNFKTTEVIDKREPTAPEDWPALNRTNKPGVPLSAVLETDVSCIRINATMAPSD